jgi:hypothetical protein
MGKPFKAKRGRVVVRLSEPERQVLQFICDELTLVLADPDPDTDVPQWAAELGLTGLGERRPAPDDPVAARLLPDAYADPERASEFRSLTEAGLRATKLSHIAAVRSALVHESVEITDTTRAWMAFLADARLMLGTRLEITEDDQMLPTDDPEYNIYLYLGYLQQTLVEELMGF